MLFIWIMKAVSFVLVVIDLGKLAM